MNTVQTLLKKVDNVKDMMERKDREERTGFMQACEYGKIEIVEFLLTEHHSYIDKQEMYMVFESARSQHKVKIIQLLLKNDEMRSIIKQKEAENITEDESGTTYIWKKIELRGKNRDQIISFNEKKFPIVTEVIVAEDDREELEVIAESDEQDGKTDDNSFAVALKASKIPGFPSSPLDMKTGKHTQNESDAVTVNTI